MRLFLTVLGLSLFMPLAAIAQCGGPFFPFVDALKQEVRRTGLSPAQTEAFFAGVRQDSRVLKADRAQGVFRKNFLDFQTAVISQNRLNTGAAMARKHAAIFDRAEREFGVSRGVLLAFWALETDFGQVQGDFNTRDALVTLSHDCRRPQLFRPQVIAAAKLFQRGDFDPVRSLGAWAGEIGQVQMLPADILRNGTDGDGDGHVNLKGSSADALISGARMIAGMGWQRGEPWLQEITVPDQMDWSKTGLNRSLSTAEWARMGVKPRDGQFWGAQGAVLLPMGRKGPAFLAYPNFKVLFEWNKSFVYVTTAAYFATRLEGAARLDPRLPEPGLGVEQMKALQQKLQRRGHDVGPVDGILGEKTREAVQREQVRLGLPADAWPTPILLQRL